MKSFFSWLAVIPVFTVVLVILPLYGLSSLLTIVANRWMLFTDYVGLESYDIVKSVIDSGEALKSRITSLIS